MNIEPDILLLRKRDSDEWDIAFKWLWPTAYAVSRNVLSSKLPNQIEDNAIEAIEAVIEKVNECRLVSEIKAILAKIAHNKGVDALRKHYSLKKGAGNVGSLTDQEDVGDIPDTTIEDLDSKFANEHNSELIHKVLENLNEKERKCIVSFYLHQKSHKQISEEHDIPMGSIGVTITRALKKMSDLMK
jgi:RNA polymerase sigma factor (sigma-70 family)